MITAEDLPPIVLGSEFKTSFSYWIADYNAAYDAALDEQQQIAGMDLECRSIEHMEEPNSGGLRFVSRVTFVPRAAPIGQP